MSEKFALAVRCMVLEKNAIEAQMDELAGSCDDEDIRSRDELAAYREKLLEAIDYLGRVSEALAAE